MKQVHPDLSDVLGRYGGLDEDWYLARYSDVAELQMSARDHFLAIGHRMGRGISRDLTSTASAWGTPHPLVAAVARRPVVSFCIPVMDRLADLQATLAANLEAGLAQEDQLEFVVLVLGRSDDTVAWIESRFAAHLQSGYLRVLRKPALPVWHFGQAKNQFLPHIAGRLYSSLDADNFVTPEEIAQLLALWEARGGSFVMHHFTGQWGDGSSGRISLPAQFVRYDPRFLPRQFDEVDAIVSACLAHPGMMFVHHPMAQTVLQAGGVPDFLATLGRQIETRAFPSPARRAPLNPRGADYGQADPATQAMQAVNEAMCFMRNAPGAPGRDSWAIRLRTGAAAWVAASDPAVIWPTLFGNVPMPRANRICVRVLTRPTHDDGIAYNPDPDAVQVLIDARPKPLPEGESDAGGVVVHPRVGLVQAGEVLWRAGAQKALAATGAEILTS